MTETMLAVVQDTFGEPDTVLHTENRAIPDPGPGQVRIRVTLSPVHNHDLWTVRGTYGFVPDLPAPAGTEALGTVDALGPGVDSTTSGITPGQRVATGSTFGVWAQYAIADAADLIPVPDELDDATAAQLVAMPFSAISLLDDLDLAPGDWLVQNSANGTVGRILSQLAAARGIHVLGLVRRDAGIEELAAQGITGIISTAHHDWHAHAAAVTGGAQVRVGLDSVGGASSKDIVSLISDGGTLVSFGAMGAPDMQVPSSAVIFRGITVRGFWGSRVSTAMAPEKKAALFGELIRRLIAGEVTLPVAATVDVQDTAAVTAAMQASTEPGRTGKILLRF